jgi:arylsulfatase A-like enzyme
MEGTWRIILWPNQIGGIPTSSLTLPAALKSLNYYTGMTGKWHLGVNKANHLDGTNLPGHHGFDYSGLVMPMGQSAPCAGSNATARAGYCFFTRSLNGANDHVTEMPMNNHSLANRQVKEFRNFLTNATHTAPGRPFFWYHSFLHVHSPVGFAQTGAFAGQSGLGYFGDEVMEMDDAVGQVLNILRGLDRPSLVFFSSDNGPYLEDYVWTNPAVWGTSSAKPLKGGKGQAWEGGHRVPAIMWGPGIVAKGRVTDEVASALDIFATSFAAAGGNLSTVAHDGNNWLEYIGLKNGGLPAWKNKALPFFCANKLVAVRYNEYKLHFATTNWLDISAYPTVTPTPASRCGGQCCPYNPAMIPAGLCMCDSLLPWLSPHVDPVLFNIRDDIHEDRPLTRKNFPQYDSVVKKIIAAVQLVNNTIDYTVHNQVDDPYSTVTAGGYLHYPLLSNATLTPCCFTIFNGQPTCLIARNAQGQPILNPVTHQPIPLPCAEPQ